MLTVTDLTEFDASTTATGSTAVPLSHADAKEGASDEEGWIAEGVTESGVAVQWFRHFGTAVPPPPTSTSATTPRLNANEEPLLIVLANEYLLRAKFTAETVAATEHL